MHSCAGGGMEGGGGTGMHPQGEGEPGAEAFKSAVDAFYGTQGAKQTCKVNKFLSTLMHFWVMKLHEVSLEANGLK